jgi:hypothetical protein
LYHCVGISPSSSVIFVNDFGFLSSAITFLSVVTTGSE